MHCSTPVLTRENVQELTRYGWPGNIRELLNAIERAVILARGGPFRFGLHESVDPAIAEPERAALLQRASNSLNSNGRSIIDALQRSGGKIYG